MLSRMLRFYIKSFRFSKVCKTYHITVRFVLISALNYQYHKSMILDLVKCCFSIQIGNNSAAFCRLQSCHVFHLCRDALYTTSMRSFLETASLALTASNGSNNARLLAMNSHQRPSKAYVNYLSKVMQCALRNIFLLRQSKSINPWTCRSDFHS